MRPPRFRFPDQVRTETREMAARMVHEGSIARSPGELEDWIAREPDARETLEDGGYGTEFTAEDLFPLLEVFVAQAGGSTAVAEPRPAPSRKGWLLAGIAVAALVVLVLVAAASGALSR